MKMDDEDMEASCALDTLLRAKEIESDSELMAKVAKIAKAKAGAINSIAKLKEVAKAKIEEPEEDEEDEKEEEPKKKDIKEIKDLLKESNRLNKMPDEDKVAENEMEDLKKKEMKLK